MARGSPELQLIVNLGSGPAGVFRVNIWFPFPVSTLNTVRLSVCDRNIRTRPDHFLCV